MKIGAFEIAEPVPELKDPHALVMIRPWVDVGSVGTLTLKQIERHFGAQPVGKLARPGTFFDFTRYRPSVKLVAGQRESQYEGPTTIMNLLSDTATELGLGMMSFMAHLPHYAQLEEDFAGTARM